ncbi:MAG: hypothetical protein K9K67_10350 [Bacteriovoracaceae bacterium]|nr:hypothetical protein [Bacteriovoracaceae bacterium]
MNKIIIKQLTFLSFTLLSISSTHANSTRNLIRDQFSQKGYKVHRVDLYAPGNKLLKDGVAKLKTIKSLGDDENVKFEAVTASIIIEDPLNIGNLSRMTCEDVLIRKSKTEDGVHYLAEEIMHLRDCELNFNYGNFRH